MTGARWETRLLELFDDLEQQAAGLEQVEREVQVADLSVSEYAQISLADRLRASVGRELTLRLCGGQQLRGRSARCGEEWLVLQDQRGEGGWLVPTDAVVGVDGLGPRAALATTASLADRLPLRSLLRRVAESGQPVQVHLRDGARREGRLARVGRDFVELLTREGAAGAPHVVPTSGLAAVRWSAW